MNARTTIILLVLLIAGIGYLLWSQTDWFRKPPGTAPSGEKETFKPLVPEAGGVRRLVLEPPGSERIVLVRRDGKWRMQEPIDAPAAESAVSSLVATLTALNYTRKYAPGDAEYPRDDLTHLSAPLRVATLTDDKDASWTIKVGRKVPLAERKTYVQLSGGEDVYVVETDLHERLARTVKDFRDMQVVKFDTDQAVSIEVRGNEHFRLVKVDKDWALDVPVSARADQAKAADLLRAASSLYATRFVDDAPKDLGAFGLAEPRLTVSVQLAPPAPASAPAAETAPATGTAPGEKGKVITIAFGAAAEGKVFARLGDEPPVFQLEESKLKDLQPKLADLRDKHVLDVGSREIVKVEAALPSGPLTLEKDNDQWRLVQPIAGPADPDSVRELTDALRDMQASEFQDNPTSLAAFGLDEPVGRLVLHFRGSDRTLTVLAGKASDSGQMGFVKPAEGKSVAVVPAREYARLIRPAAGYWVRNLVNLPEDAALARLDVSAPDRPPVAVTCDDGTFRMVSPISADADAENARAAFAALSAVRADKIVALGQTLPERFAKLQAASVTLQYRQPEPTTTSAPGATSGPATASAQAATSLPASDPAPAATSGPATASAPVATSLPGTGPATTQASQPASRPTRLVTVGPLMVVKDQGKSYVWLKDAKPLAVGELPEAFYDKVTAEMRDRAVLKIQPDKVVTLKVALGQVTMELNRSGDAWRYASDRHVRLEPDRIKGFLTDLGGIRAQRFADYSDPGAPGLARYGLDKPAMTIEVIGEDGVAARLSVSRTGPVGAKALYAVSSQTPGVFVLAAEAPEKMQKTIEELRKGTEPAP